MDVRAVRLGRVMPLTTAMLAWGWGACASCCLLLPQRWLVLWMCVWGVEVYRYECGVV